LLSEIVSDGRSSFACWGPSSTTAQAAPSYEEELLLAQRETSTRAKADAVTRPNETQVLVRPEDLKGKVPKVRIGKVEVSQLILGGNLIGGWAHARDLVYVSPLVKAHHKRRVRWPSWRRLCSPARQRTPQRITSLGSGRRPGWASL
jgi:hypothetical protein